MKLINADKYKKDIEHYRNTICYQRNVTMDDCMRILDKQEDVLDKIRAEIKNDCLLKKYPSSPFSCGLRLAMGIIDKYKAESEDNECII